MLGDLLPNSPWLRHECRTEGWPLDVRTRLGSDLEYGKSNWCLLLIGCLKRNLLLSSAGLSLVQNVMLLALPENDTGPEPPYGLFCKEDNNQLPSFPLLVSIQFPKATHPPQIHLVLKLECCLFLLRC